MFNKTKKQRPQANNDGQQTKSIDFPINEQQLRTIFEASGDVFFNNGIYRPQSPLKVTFIGCQGLVDLDLLNHLIVERLHLFFENTFE